MVTIGVTAIMAMSPNASVPGFPPTASDAPMSRASTKVLDSGPDATPPESKAMAVKRRGHAKLSAIAAAYQGARMYQMLKPSRTRHMERPTDAATPRARAVRSTGLRMFPPDTSSTLSVSTQIAGSAQTTSAPSTNPRGMRIRL